MLKVAIIGAGFSGLAIAYNLLHSFKVHVTIYDLQEAHQRTSGIAAGLMHGFTGPHAKKNRFADEGLQASLHLLQVAQAHTSSCIFQQNGLLRVAVGESQVKDFQHAAHLFPHECQWLEIEQARALFSPLEGLGALWIKHAVQVDCPLYLQALAAACESMGATQERVFIKSLSHLQEYDHIIVATGAFLNQFIELKHLQVRKVKGQLLIYPLSSEEEIPSLPLNSQAYLLRSLSLPTVVAGATFEKQFSTDAPELKTALADIEPKIKQFFPTFSPKTLLECKVGFRASAAGHLPLIAQIDKKTWVMSGMGSKGLLYHAYFAKKLVSMIFSPLS